MYYGSGSSARQDEYVKALSIHRYCILGDLVSFKQLHYVSELQSIVEGKNDAIATKHIYHSLDEINLLFVTRFPFQRATNFANKIECD